MSNDNDEKDRLIEEVTHMAERLPRRVLRVLRDVVCVVSLHARPNDFRPQKQNSAE